MVHLTTHMKRWLVMENPASQQAGLPLAAAKNPRRSEKKDCNSGDSAPATPAAGIPSHEDISAEWTKYLTEVSEFPAHAMYSLLRAPHKRFSYTLDSLGRCPHPACSFCSVQAATQLEFHVPYMNCFVHRWLCVIQGPKPPLHCHNWISFGKSQDTECFLIPCTCHVSSRLPPIGETCKYAMAPINNNNDN